jgi:predicted alpha/beta hydrolase family esterase
MTTSYLVLHGWQNHRPEGHWHRWLTESLRAQGQLVAYPQLPDADDPALDAWLDVISQEFAMLPAGERVVVAHSLGVIAWVHAVARHGLMAGRTLLVAPPGPTFMAQNPEISGFAPVPAGIDGSSWDLVCSDSDPCCVEGTAEWFDGLYGCRVHEIAGAGHLGLDDGYGSWPAALNWCLDGTASFVDQDDSPRIR